MIKEEIKEIYISLSKEKNKKNGLSRRSFKELTGINIEKINDLREECGFKKRVNKHSFSKEEIKLLLKLITEEKGMPLTKEEIDINPKLPSCSTVLRIFNTWSLEKIWEEIFGEKLKNFADNKEKGGKEYLKSKMFEYIKKNNEIPSLKNFLIYSDLTSTSFYYHYDSYYYFLEQIDLLKEYKKAGTKSKLLKLMKYENENIKRVEFCKKYKISSKTIVKYFGSYKKLKELAGHTYKRRADKFSEKELLERISSYYRETNLIPKFGDVKGSSIIANRIGWNKALEKALGIKRTYSKNDIIDEFLKLEKNLKKIPSSKEFYSNTSISNNVVKELFGGWNEFKKSLNYDTTNMQSVESNDEIKKLYMDLSKKLEKSNGATKAEWVKHTNYSSSVFNRFGGINGLRIECGFEVQGKGVYWTREELGSLLLKEYKEKGSELTQEEIDKNDNLPYTTTFLKAFKTTKIKEVWKEVNSEKNIVLLELYKVKFELGRVPKRDEFLKRSFVTRNKIQKNFESWTNLLLVSGSTLNRYKNYSKEFLIKEVKECSDKLEKTPTLEEFLKFMKSKNYNTSMQVIINHFETWNNLLNESELTERNYRSK